MALVLLFILCSPCGEAGSGSSGCQKLKCSLETSQELLVAVGFELQFPLCPSLQSTTAPSYRLVKSQTSFSVGCSHLATTKIKTWCESLFSDFCVVFFPK